jgi:hypothetical protein
MFLTMFFVAVVWALTSLRHSDRVTTVYFLAKDKSVSRSLSMSAVRLKSEKEFHRYVQQGCQQHDLKTVRAKLAKAIK